ncbi:hypothetical protein [Breoghania sp.]|uniref:hypothetical protein n=1 Tax=Breoghania sp. TaxID=2065378 RepID=UPI002612F8AD|nr:hypothetical protein [Breoghania sp.]MDJ0932933.1 hypothetical protein [Breoghania sp.]
MDERVEDSPLTPDPARAGLDGWHTKASSRVKTADFLDRGEPKDLVDILHRRGLTMLAFVVVAMGACLAVTLVSVWIGLGAIATAVACWLVANLALVLVTVLIGPRLPSRY